MRCRTLATDADAVNALRSHRVEFQAIPDAVRDCILTYILEARRDALTLRSDVICA